MDPSKASENGVVDFWFSTARWMFTPTPVVLVMIFHP